MSSAEAGAKAAGADRPVYMVVAGETIDVERMANYARALAESGLYGKAQGYYINSPRPIDTFEGEPPPNFVTLIVRFPSIEAAREFWYSPQYQDDIRPMRLNPSAGNYTVTVYEGLDLP